LILPVQDASIGIVGAQEEGLTFSWPRHPANPACAERLPVLGVHGHGLVVGSSAHECAARRAEWQPEGALVVVQTARPDSGRLVFRAWARFTDFRIGVLATLAGLLASCGDWVRRCSECGEAFVPVSRQKFCAEACQQRHFDRRRGEDRVTKPPAFKLQERQK
jgi:hypothetical protein